MDVDAGPRFRALPSYPSFLRVKPIRFVRQNSVALSSVSNTAGCPCDDTRKMPVPRERSGARSRSRARAAARGSNPRKPSRLAGCRVARYRYAPRSQTLRAASRRRSAKRLPPPVPNNSANVAFAAASGALIVAWSTPSPGSNSRFGRVAAPANSPSHGCILSPTVRSRQVLACVDEPFCPIADLQPLH